MNAALSSFEAQWRARAPDVLEPIREQAMQRFLKLGLPGMRDETWRYTDLRSLAAQRFAAAGCEVLGDVHALKRFSFLDQELSARVIVMVNGCAPIPAAIPQMDGFEINTIKESSKQDPQRMMGFFRPASDADERRWVLLNTALFTDGLHIKIVKSVSAPLVILHVSSGTSEQAVHPRIIIEALPGSSATIIEHHISQGDVAPLCNSNSHIVLRKDARLEHYRVYATGGNDTQLNTLDIHQDAGSHCKQFTIAIGGSLVRSSLEARLSQPGASLDSYSLLVGHEDRHLDCVNIVTHAAADTRSRQTARAIASGISRVIFNSKVIVDAAAVRCDSLQSCRGLLLSPEAEIDTRPQLEIHTDEVKCAHGATTGRLDPDMFFYLLSRGLDRETAQSLLVYAFLADALAGMSVSTARSAIENALISQLPDSQLLRKFR